MGTGQALLGRRSGIEEVLMSKPHHALLFIMTALPWQCLLQTSLLAAVAAAESCLKVRGDGPRVYHSFL